MMPTPRRAAEEGDEEALAVEVDIEVDAPDPDAEMEVVSGDPTALA